MTVDSPDMTTTDPAAIPTWQNRAAPLAALGWKARDAEWLALVALHSGVFLRSQWCRYFHDANREAARVLVRQLIDKQLAIEDTRLRFPGGARAVLLTGKPIYRALDIEDVRHRRGKQTSLTLLMRPTTIALAPWHELGYAWYSGSAVYEKSVELTKVEASGTVMLDLGDVRHHAEVIVNNRSLGSRLWPPYRFDLTGAVHSGSNTVRVRVSNLAANEMRWRRDETRMGDPWHRYWHEDNIEPERLVSGLLGPVQVQLSP